MCFFLHSANFQQINPGRKFAASYNFHPTDLMLILYLGNVKLIIQQHNLI